MKKILFISVHLNYGGAEVGLLTVLKNIDRKRFDCSVLSIEPKGAIGKEIEDVGIEVIYLNESARLFNIPLIWRIAGVLYKKKPDILHTSLFYANFFGRLAALIARPAVIITEEHSMHIEKRFYHILLDRWLSNVTDRIRVCSHSVLDFTSRQEGIPKEKFCVIYNAVDAERFNISQTKDDARRSAGFTPDDFIVGSVGSLIPLKGHRFLVEAVSYLAGELPRLKLVIAGEGKCRDELNTLAKEKGISEKVIFLGVRKEIPQLMRMMDIFVLPSLQEGFPCTIVEAMYMGLPVIASNISGIPEVITSGDNGILVEPGNADTIRKSILALYRDESLRNRLRQAARRKIESAYLPFHYVKQFEALYDELTEKKKVKP